MPKIEFTAPLWSPLEGKGWTFVTLPVEASRALGKRGRLAVAGTIEGHPFRTSAFPDGKGSHEITVNAEMRRGGGVEAGETARFVVEPVSDEVEAAVPEDLAAALAASPEAEERFAAITSKARAEWVAWVEAAKQAATRERRIAGTVDRLLAGKKRPSD